MNSFLKRLILVLAGCTAWADSLTVITYTNFIRQIQQPQPAGTVWDMSVAAVSPSGGSLSPLAIDPGGAQFELWTVANTTPLTNYKLDSKYVGTYIPVAFVAIRSEDPYAVIPRTRADRPFYVDYEVTGLLSGATDPVASKSVTLYRHVQSYGTTGTGVNLDRTQATMYSQASVTTNGPQTLTYAVNSVPGSNRAKVRGEERFSIFSIADYQAPASQLASQFIQIWPVADGTIAGITANQMIRMALPQLTITLNDLYPSSTTYAQVYKGNPALGTEGTVVPGSSRVFNDTVPQNIVLTLNNYDSCITSDGHWTMELLTVTPFGTDRLYYVSFDVNRTIEMNGTFTTIE